MKLNCHCGNVQLTVPKAPAALTRCNCSICHRHGALWGYYEPGEVSVHVGEKGVHAYRWGDENIDFMFCQHCGCGTHYETTEKCEVNKVGVNFRMTSHKAIEHIRIRDFDGADTWEFLN